MPPVTRLRISALRELAEGQRFTPARTVARQIDRIERLALEIDPDTMYAEDWIARRITGFPMRIDDPRQIVGAALLADLSALAEHLSDRAAIPGTSAESMVGLDALASRWSVSRKTIERYRRAGLIGRRVRDGSGVTRIVFSPGAIEAFAKSHPNRISRAAGFTRLTDAERSRARRWAREYRRRLGWSVAQASARCAVRLGRSRGSVLLALETSGDETLRPRASAPDHAARLAERAIARGIPVGAIAERLGRSRASVHRLALESRARRIGALNLSTPLDDRLDAASSRDILASADARSGLRDAEWDSLDGALRAAREARPIDTDLERARALAYHALRWTVGRDVKDLRRRSPAAARVDAWETRLRWAAAVKRSMVGAEVSLVARTAEGILGTSLDSLDPVRAGGILLAGLAIVSSVVDGFDPTRGGRIAGACSLPLTRWITERAQAWREPTRPQARRRTEPTDRIAGWDRSLTPWDAWIREPESVMRVWRTLDEPASAALALRFGLSGDRPHEFAEIATTLGITPRRAGIAVADAIARCRRMSAEASD